ncbi:DNA polymerase III subunit beta [Grimontia hollisae]|uniref:Beta sliding clamp n=1 Tax=Grimontia hollisae CIP 101886 TaxID=675812 RepID=D0I2Z5_GRIHO|nr:DNA polymerase III subunit beta [Grimontia hollisae]AMG30593.1 DNA polymerase III subunit beta [Grimontia hollisae]EEY74195.1 DNA polymerase III beta subunit [Grimontia hollisae CIP 101886]STO41793.1 DNA polymerase III subunit beta [Grimontia hollisae]STQ74408.1 DNA polymerase III subunit beta [Grimontia hollisae]
MKFTVTRDQFLKPLQQVSGALGGRPTLPILGNILLKVESGQLSMTCTDLEVELIANLPLESEAQEGAVTVPSRKFLDICRGLPDSASISFSLEGDRAVIRSGRSRFTLSTLPAADFPNIEDWQSTVEFTLPQGKLRQLMESTAFSMANQDVRYFLNGMLLETEGTTLRSVATDGHRMAVGTTLLDNELAAQQVIVPRKGVTELMRMLDNPDAPVTIQIGSANIRALVNQFVFTSKLVDGRFPDYRRVLPQSSNKIMEAGCDDLRQAFSRAAILSNEKFRGVRLNLSAGQLRISAHNPEQEEAEEFVDVNYDGDDLEIGFNVSYVLDVLNTLKSEQVRFSMTDGTASTLVEDCNNDDAMYVVMPIRL